MTEEPGWLLALRERRTGCRLGGNIRYADELASTNDTARSWLDEGGPDGLIVLAGRQTSGRGRRGRTWSSPVGGLYLSAGLRVDPGPETTPCLTFLGAVAAAETLRGLGIPATVRWPNDVDVGERKIAGVLAECRFEGKRLIAAVLGLGLNLRPVGEAGDAQRSVTSLEEEAGAEPLREELLDRLLSRLEVWYLSLDSGPSLLLRRFRELCPGGEGRRVIVQEDGEAYEAQTRGITEEGALRLERASGRIVELRTGELRRIRER